MQVSSTAVPATATQHAALLELAREGAQQQHTLEDTASTKLFIRFEGTRIYYQILWDIMNSWLLRSPHGAAICASGSAQGGGGGGPVISDLLNSGSDSIFKDYSRAPNDLRLDGLTVMIAAFNILTDANHVILSILLEGIEMLICPPLDSSS